VVTVNTVALWDATPCSLIDTFIFLEFQIFSHKINSKNFLCQLRNSKNENIQVLNSHNLSALKREFKKIAKCQYRQQQVMLNFSYNYLKVGVDYRIV